jgi:hypothetical protein
MTSGPFRTDSILPPPPEGAVPVLHNREYRVEAYRLRPDRLLIRGALRDQRPPGVAVPDDPDPITIHHMVLSLEVSFPQLVIEEVNTEFVTHPRLTCPDIIDHYDNLVGLSLTRGFTHKVRELFGGPRGCSHTTALLQAMAPAAMQSFIGMRAFDAAEQGLDHPLISGSSDDQSWTRLTNTCHVWHEDGPTLAARQAGEPEEVSVPIRRRLAELGRDVPTGGG